MAASHGEDIVGIAFDGLWEGRGDGANTHVWRGNTLHQSVSVDELSFEEMLLTPVARLLESGSRNQDEKPEDR